MAAFLQALPQTSLLTEVDIKLAAQIVDAMKEYDSADAVRKEKAVAAGKLLAEAHERHPGEEAFGEFLQLAGGIHIRRAQDLIAIALGRKDFNQHQIKNAAAQQRHRAKLKAEKILLPKPEPKSSTHYGNAAATDVAETVSNTEVTVTKVAETEKIPITETETADTKAGAVGMESRAKTLRVAHFVIAAMVKAIGLVKVRKTVNALKAALDQYDQTEARRAAARAIAARRTAR